MNEVKISALLITKNEAHNIKECIENLSFADEIIIVDSYSTDTTSQIVAAYPKVKFYQHTFENFASQRNIALEYAHHPWILFMDADERLTPALTEEILSTVRNAQADAYYFYRTFYFEKQPMHFTGLQNDKNIRLFRKEVGKYTGLVHEKLMINGKISSLHNKMIHYSYHDYKSYKEKLKHYGILKAKEKYSKGASSNVLMQYIHSIFCFFQRFIIRLGIFDGKKGAIISYLMAYSVWIRYKEIRRLKNT